MELLKHNIDYIIIGILGVMSFFVLWYTIERVIFYSRVNINGYTSIETLEEALTKNLTTLYIIYSNAPYIGLLGTVAGIMITFYDMGMASKKNVSCSAYIVRYPRPHLAYLWRSRRS